MNEELDYSKLPNISVLSNVKGKKEGEIKVFRTGN